MSRWRLGISVGRGFVSRSLYHYHRCRYILARNTLSHYNYHHAFSTFSHPLNSDHVKGYHESKHLRAVKEKEEPFNYNIGATTLNAPNSWKELEKQNIKCNQVKKGDVINIRDFLFSEDRDYLIRFNDQTQVKAEQLAGKVIVIYFVSLSLHPRVKFQEDWDTFHLKEVYNYLLKSHHAIEIVLVAIDDGDVTESNKRFEEIFSRMPWTAIPFSDEKCRKFLQPNLCVRDTCTVVVDSTGVVLQEYAKTIIEDYGALGFPFSDEKRKLLVAEENAAVERPSLLSLLGSPQRDYVITNKRVEVPIHTLEEKVVGLYFYNSYSSSFAQDIRAVYEEMSKTKQNFEVVLIYLDDWPTTRNEELFWETFEAMPWLALPYKDPSLLKLLRIFDYDQQYDMDHIDQLPEFVIFGPHGEFIEPFGRYVMQSNPVYPFTLEKAAKSLVEKVENLKMEMLWHPDTVLRKADGSQMRISQLAGKRVIVFFEGEICSLQIFLVKLREKYVDLKGTDEEFEVIHILKDKMMQNTSMEKPMLPIRSLPWFVSLESELLPGFNIYTCYPQDIWNCVLVAFDGDGKLVRRTSCCTLADPDFPFFSGSLEEESLSQLIELLKWDYWNFYEPNKGRIYTLHKKLREKPIPDSKYRVWRTINAA